MKYFLHTVLALMIFVFATDLCHGHVPYIEYTDYNEESPFVAADSVENSKAVYAWFETGTDIDIFTFEVTDPVRLFALTKIVLVIVSIEAVGEINGSYNSDFAAFTANSHLSFSSACLRAVMSASAPLYPTRFPSLSRIGTPLVESQTTSPFL